ncbi:MAG: Gp138 family membrane-puncturing spike protein [bacterium]
MENETPTLAHVIREAIRSQILDLHTAMPARVEKYDPASQKADVKPLLRKKYKASDIDTEFPVIPAVPVQWPSAGGGKAYLHLPLKAGDLGIIIVCERTMEGWLCGDGQITSPKDPRHHNLSDAVFVPGIRPFKKALAGVSSNNMVLQNDKLRIELDPSGKVSIEGTSSELITVLVQVLTHLISAKVLTSWGASPFTADTIANFTQDKVQLTALKR